MWEAMGNKSAPERLAEMREMPMDLVIEALLRDESEIVRHEAAFVLGETAAPDEEALWALLRAADDTSILVRHEVALALVMFPEEVSAKCLVKLLKDPIAEVSRSAEYALIQMLERARARGPETGGLAGTEDAPK